MLKPRTIAIAGSIAALSFAAAPVAALASTPHHTTTSTVYVDRSHDRGSLDKSSLDKSRDHTSPDYSRDVRDH